MRHRSVAGLMTPTAVRVQRGTPFKEIARLLDEFAITAAPDRNVVRAERAMREHSVKRLPVVDGTGLLIGILSGTVSRHSLIPVVVRLCQSVDGVVTVINRLSLGQDDLSVGSPQTTEV